MGYGIGFTLSSISWAFTISIGLPKTSQGQTAAYGQFIKCVFCIYLLLVKKDIAIALIKHIFLTSIYTRSVFWAWFCSTQEYSDGCLRLKPAKLTFLDLNRASSF